MSHSKYLIYKTLYMMAEAIGGADPIFLPELPCSAGNLADQVPSATATPVG